MIEGLKPYAEYKESGERWLGQLPSSWELRRAKFLFREVDERSRTGKEELLSVSHKTGVTPRSQKNVTMFMAESNVGHKICRPQDLVINTLWAWMAALGVSRHTGIVSPAYGVYRLINTETFLPRFADQLLRTPLYADEYQRRSTGVNSSRLRLYPEAFFRIAVVLPPPDEQAAIVRFLDHANWKIDGFIRAKRKLIGLLNEQKQAIIHRAVTRGLDPNVSLKPSGIPWLGEIPRHWETRKLKQCITRIEQGWSPQCDGQPAASNEWGVLKVGCVNKDKFNGDQNKKLPATFLPDFSLEIRDGDILMSRANTRELLGLAALAENPRRKLILCDKLFRFRPLTLCFIPKFLVLALRGQPSRAQIESSTNGASSSMQNIGQGVVKGLWVSMPPLDEQAVILAALTEATDPLNTAIARTEREIALMQEYRTRLTADIVTGKLDVREAAGKLPDLPIGPAADAFTDEAPGDSDMLDEIEAEES
ncbi:hypothetical protein [Zoogloea sp.]|uniref:hypothetical protein n=1 Tax=Zoogloea sp. TaxID=49181 RepID=UPI0025F861B9|nr:hypothetical protein [Zoogloea sp.]MCK6395177.1 hypothetical protein [Zoogloea sp.]